MALQWMILTYMVAAEAAIAILLTLPSPKALKSRFVSLISLALQPSLFILPFSAFQLLDIYWKNEHRLMCTGEICTASERDRYEKTLTGTENFSVWSRAMRIAILGRNKLGFIDGSCKREAYGPNLTNLWDRCNAIVLSWIMNCVSKELLGGIVYSTDAAAVWKDLRERYDKVDGSRIFQLHKEIATINQGTNSISVYFSRLRDLWVEFDSLTPIPSCECENSREFGVVMHNQKLLQFLLGLNESYEQARGQILMMIPLPSLNKAYSMLIERESQRTISQTSGGSSDINALFSTKNTSLPVPKQRQSYTSSYDPNAFCDYCKRKGHTQAICYQLHGYPPGYDKRKKDHPHNNINTGKGKNHTDRRSYHTAHNVVSDSSHYSGSGHGQKYTGDMNSSRSISQDSPENFAYGRGTGHPAHMDYYRGMNVLHDQYNQILHMLGRTNVQGGTEDTSTSHNINTGGANLTQESFTSADLQGSKKCDPMSGSMPSLLVYLSCLQVLQGDSEH